MKPDRDASIGKLLERTLRSMPASAGVGECLDAETLASWVDGGLTGPELEQAEAHLATCARCQNAMAVIARSTAPPPITEPWWRRHLGLGWLVPLTAGAAAVALWVAVPRPVQTPDGYAPVLQSARTQDEQVPAPAAANEMPEEARTRTPAPPPQPERRLSNSVGQVRSDDLRAERADAKVAPSATTPIAAEPTPMPATGPIPAAPPPNFSGGRDSTLAAGAAGQLAGSAPPATPPSAAAESANAIRERSAFAPSAVSTRLITSPDPRVVWRLAGGGTVQRSIDNGRSWEDARTNQTADLTAGAAPSPTVCWIVGRRGVVLRTTNGRDFERVPFPESIDLTGIQASDARTARVTTSDGRTLATTDGGSTWN